MGFYVNNNNNENNDDNDSNDSSIYNSAATHIMIVKKAILSAIINEYLIMWHETWETTWNMNGIAFKILLYFIMFNYSSR